MNCYILACRPSQRPHPSYSIGQVGSWWVEHFSSAFPDFGANETTQLFSRPRVGVLPSEQSSVLTTADSIGFAKPGFLGVAADVGSFTPNTFWGLAQGHRMRITFQLH
jgi:hypothetical protein